MKKLIWKLCFFSDNFQPNLVKKKQKVSAKTWMPPTHHVPMQHDQSVNWHRNPIHGILATGAQQKNTCLLKKLGFQLLSPKTCRWKVFVHQKIPARSITTLSRQLSSKQSGSCECVWRKPESQLRNAVAYGKCLIRSEKIQKNQRKPAEENITITITIRGSSEWCSND